MKCQLGPTGIEGTINSTLELEQLNIFQKQPINKFILEKGKYAIDSDIKINSNSELVILAGAELYFAENKGIDCKGKIHIKGKKSLEAILTAKNKRKGWKGVTVHGDGKAFINYAKFSYGRGCSESYISHREKNKTAGGAISVFGIAQINNSYFENNSADHGGAIFVAYEDTRLKIGNNNIFKNNSADHGGAIHSTEYGRLKIGNNNIFEGNSAADHGGAIYLTEYTSSPFMKANNIFKNNSADEGGAIYFDVIYNEKFLLMESNNIFKNNSAADHGGAIYLRRYTSSPFMKANNIFENNSADHGGAIYVLGLIYYMCFSSPSRRDCRRYKSANIFRGNRPNDIESRL